MKMVILQLLRKSLPFAKPVSALRSSQGPNSASKPVSALRSSQGPNSASKPDPLEYVQVTFFDINFNIIFKFRLMYNNLAFVISQIIDAALKSSIFCT